MEGADWRGHVWRDSMGVEFVELSTGEKWQARLEEGRVGPDLHELFGVWRGESERARAGWSVAVPVRWKGAENLLEDGTFRLLRLRDPEGRVLALEFHYRRGTQELLEALGELTGQRIDDQEVSDGDGEPQLEPVSEAGGPAEAGGAGVVDPEEHQEGGALRWRPDGRGQGRGEELRAVEELNT